MPKTLTRKQVRLFELMVDEGKNMRRAAETMGVEYNTAHGHMERAKKKLGASTSGQAMVLFDRQRYKVRWLK